MNDLPIDHYRVLQVDSAANPLVIQAAYRALARIFHPDVFGDEDEMKRINAAWEVLGDPALRAKYDSERAGRHLAPPVTPPAAAEAACSWASRFRDPFPDASAPVVEGASPPRGMPFGPILTFGRYEGWSLGQVARVDMAYLEWLRRAPAGRGLWDEIDAVLRSSGMPGVDRRRYERDRREHSLGGAPLRA
jgi:curved DNA-binding protein CbpA